MKRLLLTLPVLIFTASLAAANCYYVSPDIAPTESQAAARARGSLLEGKGPEWRDAVITCKRGVYVEHQVWLCEQEAGACEKTMRLEESVNQLYDRGQHQGLRPHGEGQYERWPSGERYNCSRAFGCVRDRN